MNIRDKVNVISVYGNDIFIPTAGKDYMYTNRVGFHFFASITIIKKIGL